MVNEVLWQSARLVRALLRLLVRRTREGGTAQSWMEIAGFDVQRLTHRDS